MEQFEGKLHEDLHLFLLSMKEVDERLPECPDVEEKWEEIAKAYMKDKRGYDSMDEYIREEVLLLSGADYTVLEKTVGECASRVYNTLMHQRFEPGTKEAFNGYVACLHQLYLMGAAIQLKRMGYHMTKIN